MRLSCWFTILQKHLDDFGQVREELVDGSSLGMGTFPARYVPYEEASVRVAFDNEDNPVGSRLTGG